MFGEKKFDLKTWLKSGGKKQYYEHLSFLLVFISVAMIWVGLLLGSFVPFVVYLATFGALILIPAIILYIASQLMEEKKSETAPASQ